MVDPIQLGSDVLQNVVVLATPPLLWFAVAYLAWEDGPRARIAGIGRNTFWLLLPGAILGSLANLPFFAWTGNILAINLGGGLIPLLLSALLLRRNVADFGRFFAVFLAAFAAQTGGSYAFLFLFPPSGPLLNAAVGLAIAGPAVVVALVALGERDPAVRLSLRRAGGLLGLSGLALYLTFLTTAAVPGLGIVSNFPEYLLAPTLVGVLAIVFAPSVLALDRPQGLGFGYAAATFGVLVGADVLRQPPLYGGGIPRLYAIGGAGAADLLYLAGLLALGVGYVTLRLLDRPRPAEAPARAAFPLRASLDAAFAGRSEEAVPEAARAAREAAARARLLLGVPEPAPGAGTWEGLPAPPWIEADQRNLDALARKPPADPREGVRAWMAGRWLVHFGHSLAGRGFGTPGRRVAAFLLDLLLLTVPGGVLWYLGALSGGSTLGAVLANLPFNAAVYGYMAFGLVYFVVAETVFGTTFGKRLLDLRVSDRSLGDPALLRVLVRDLPKLLPLWAVANTIAIAVAIVVVGTGLGTAAPGPAGGGGLLPNLGIVVFLGAAAAIGVGIPGLVSVLFIRGSEERQRVGDLLAGTWVVRAGLRAPGPAPRPPPAAVPSG